jgi:hypothetical protein
MGSVGSLVSLLYLKALAEFLCYSVIAYDAREVEAGWLALAAVSGPNWESGVR